MSQSAGDKLDRGIIVILPTIRLVVKAKGAAGAGAGQSALGSVSGGGRHGCRPQRPHG